jgi:uncharacterized membrane protein
MNPSLAHAVSTPIPDPAASPPVEPTAAAEARGRARAGRKTPAALTAVLLMVSIAYPAVVYLSLGHVEPRWIALLLVLLALARAWVTRERFWLGAAGIAVLLALASFRGDRWGPLQLYPALVNLVLFGVFASSLWRGPTVVERMARLREPDLPAAAVAYTRRVTQVWCGFFIANGAMAVATALWASAATWALYNGLVAYIAMGVLMGGEWLVRRRVRARIAARQASLDASGDAPAATDGALHG